VSDLRQFDLLGRDDGDITVRCWHCAVSHTLRVNQGIMAIDVTQWCEAHRCPGQTVNTNLRTGATWSLDCPCGRGDRELCLIHRDGAGADSNISSSDEGSQPVPEMIPGSDADPEAGGREWRVAWNVEGDRKHCVAELTEEGLKMVVGGLEAWQAYAIVAVLDPPFSE
jgi:hypothetical protein